jgi:hypothetical protein
MLIIFLTLGTALTLNSVPILLEPPCLYMYTVQLEGKIYIRKQYIYTHTYTHIYKYLFIDMNINSKYKLRIFSCKKH